MPPEFTAAAPATSTVIPVQTSTPSNATQTEQTTGQPSVGTGFSIPSEFSSKNWKSPEDVFKAYSEAEKALSTHRNERDQYFNIIKELQPYADDIDKLITEINARKAQDQTTQGGKKPDPNDMRLKAHEAQIQDYGNRMTRSALNSADKSFQKQYPDHEEYRARISELLTSKVVQSRDLMDSDANLEALESAYKIAKQEAADKQAAGRRAGAVAGGGVSGGGAGVDLKSTDAMREFLKQ